MAPRWVRNTLGVVLTLVLAAAAGALDVPYLSGRVNDNAGLLDPSQREAIEAQLAALEERTSAQLVVLTLPSLEGEPLEDFAHRVAETWQLGQAGQDNGVLLLIAKDDRKLRIEVGYGLEGTITDALAKRVIDDVIVPRFRAGDFPSGVSAGVAALVSLIDGDPSVLPPEGSGGGGEATELGWMGTLILSLVLLGMLSIFNVVAVLSPGFQGWFVYLFMIPFNVLFPLVFLGSFGVFWGAAYIVGAPMLKILLPRTARGKKWMLTASRGGGSRGGWSSGSSRSSGGSSFSGGGGSFGGGGASGGW